MTLGEKIREARMKKGISQTELAKLLGYKSRSSINKIEVEGRDVPRSMIVKFAQVLGVTPSYLMGWDNDEQSDHEYIEIVNMLQALSPEDFILVKKLIEQLVSKQSPPSLKNDGGTKT